MLDRQGEISSTRPLAGYQNDLFASKLGLFLNAAPEATDICTERTMTGITVAIVPSVSSGKGDLA